MATQYKITITGTSPLLMHQDNFRWDEKIKEWQNDPANKKATTPGDDRTPAHKWIGNLYQDMGNVVIPADNLMTMLREGGKRIPTGKGQQTFKSQSQSGIIVDQAAWPVIVEGGEIDVSDILDLTSVSDFAKHEEYAENKGFELFCKRAKVGQNKHIRVRPLFRNWQANGSVTVLDATITEKILALILSNAGAYCGLGDWRPSAPKSPGQFGKFTAEIERA